MKNSFSSLASTSILALVAAAFALPGCSDEPASNPPPDTKVDVPTIEGAVTADKFCGLADQIACAGAVGCCSGAPIYANAEECLAASSCDGTMGKLLNSALVTDGTLVYDANAAGDWLRARAATTAACGAEKDMSVNIDFLVGTRNEGADCSVTAGDDANAFSCKPGLTCVQSTDAATGVETGTCVNKGAPQPGGQYGDACASDEDCASGPCENGKCGVDAALMCEAPAEPIPPSNATPAKLSIYVSARSNSGTSNTVTLRYIAQNTTTEYFCTFATGLKTGEQASCDVTAAANQKTWTSAPSNTLFYVKTNGNDGLLVDSVCPLDANGNSINCAGSFYDGVSSAFCDGGSASDWGWYDRCWVDGDDHGSCNELKFKLDDGNDVSCSG